MEKGIQRIDDGVQRIDEGIQQVDDTVQDIRQTGLGLFSFYRLLINNTDSMRQGILYQSRF